MSGFLVAIKGRNFGLDVDNNLLLRDLATNAYDYVPRSADITKIVKLTQAAYDALSPPVATTLYVIVG